MKKEIPVLDIVDECNFSADNPFDIQQPLFPNLSNYLQPKLISYIEKQVFKTWVDTGFVGESTGVVFYDIIAKRMLLDRYSGDLGHLPAEQVDKINNSFDIVIKDEARHSKIFLGILQKMNFTSRYNIDYITGDRGFAEHVTDKVSNGLYSTKNNQASLLNHVCPMIIGEAYLFSCYSLFYKLSTNENKKLIFRSLMQDESNHLNHFIKLIEYARVPRENIDEIRQELHINIFDHSAFEIREIVPLLNTLVKDPEKRAEIYNNIYQSEHHQAFQDLYYRKIYQFYNILYPEVSEDDMKNTVKSCKFSEVFERNTNNRDMLYEKSLLNQ